MKLSRLSLGIRPVDRSAAHRVELFSQRSIILVNRRLVDLALLYPLFQPSNVRIEVLEEQTPLRALVLLGGPDTALKRLRFAPAFKVPPPLRV